MIRAWTLAKSIARWIGDRLKDLFYATGNENAELARVVTGLLTGVIIFAVYWNSLHLGKEIELNGLLTGLAAFIGAAGLGIAAKDFIRKKLKPPGEGDGE